MRKVISVIMVLFIVISIPSAFAHYPKLEIKTVEDILQFCEFYYDEYLMLGMNTLVEQHPQYPNLRACGILYEHIAWSSNHPLRDRVLIAEIEKYLGNSEYLKERHIKEFDKIPDWVKRDAKLWISGKNTDSKFAYGIRSLVNANVINPTAVDRTEFRSCGEPVQCLMESDYAKYSYSNKFDDTYTEKFYVKEISRDKNAIVVERITRDGKQNYETYIANDGKIAPIKNCCEVKQIIFETPLNVGSVMDDLVIIGETNHAINGKIRTAMIAKSNDGADVVTIDKKTGLLLSWKHEETMIVKNWWNIIILDTNVFEEKNGISYDMSIPKWVKTSTMWFIEGRISESEYLSAMQYLIEKNIVRV